MTDARAEKDVGVRTLVGLAMMAAGSMPGVALFWLVLGWPLWLSALVGPFAVVGAASALAALFCVVAFILRAAYELGSLVMSDEP